MSRMNQVMQVGVVEGNTHIYIEDYAYTYLKKQKGKEKTKYFLYGEKEEEEQCRKLYIYGIGEKPKMEQTYFKDYYPLGFLKFKDNERKFITLNGQEEKITGFYVFYAPNQAMQEYLVEHHKEEKKDEPENKPKRQAVQESFPIKETIVPLGKYKLKKRKKENQNDNFIYSFCGIAIAVAMAFVLTSANGQKKIEIFKQVVAETMANTVMKTASNDLIIEEKSISQTQEITKEKEESASVNMNETKIEINEEESYEQIENASEKITSEQEKVPNKGTNDISELALSEQEKALEKEMNNTSEQAVSEQKNIVDKENESVSEQIAETKEQISVQEEKKKENIYEEYIVKKGDTLATICKRKYGTLSNMQEICKINNIKNADHIEPGQKIYLLK